MVVGVLCGVLWGLWCGMWWNVVVCVGCSASQPGVLVVLGGFGGFAVRPSASQCVPTCRNGENGGLQCVPNELFIKVPELGVPGRPSASHRVVLQCVPARPTESGGKSGCAERSAPCCMCFLRCVGFGWVLGVFGGSGGKVVEKWGKLGNLSGF